MSSAAGPADQAARRFASSAATHGIDLSLMWGTVDSDATGRPVRVREVCLAVAGAGRTAMLFLSSPRPGMPSGDRERAAALSAACEALAAGSAGRPVRLAQALPEPRETWWVDALRAAGFTDVGELAYLRRSLGPRAGRGAEPAWPAGVSVRTIGGMGPGAPDRAALAEALERSYIETLDCPELCGLRTTDDVLDSHRATGAWDPALWRLVFLDGRAHGCMLLNRCPDQGTVELVYLGLSPDLRGRRLGSLLLEWGLAGLSVRDGAAVVCAVDRRNLPARKLYERAGFREFTARRAFVKPF